MLLEKNKNILYMSKCITTLEPFYKNLKKELDDGHNNIKKRYRIITTISSVIIFIIVGWMLYNLYHEKSGSKLDEIIVKLLLALIGLLIISIVLTYWLYDSNYNTTEIYKNIANVKQVCHYQPKIKKVKPPLSEMNPNTGKTIDTTVKDFYWPCVYRPYRSNNKGTYYESCYMLQEAVDIGFRGFSLEINNKDNQVVVGKNIKIDDCFNIIKKGYSNDLPTLLFFEISYGNINYLHLDLYNKIQSHFGDKLLFIQQGFNGMGSKFLLNDVPIKDTLGKYIIVTNLFPTNNTYFNGIINSVIADNYQYMHRFDYTKSHLKKGIMYNMVDTKKFTTDNKLYTTAVIPKKNVGMNIKDCNKYGIQFSFIDLTTFRGDSSNPTNDSIKFFVKSDSTLVLKPSKLRYFPKKIQQTVKQSKALSYGPVKIPHWNGFIPKHITF